MITEVMNKVDRIAGIFTMSTSLTMQFTIREFS
jgi:hypothetical protein